MLAYGQTLPDVCWTGASHCLKFSVIGSSRRLAVLALLALTSIKPNKKMVEAGVEP